MNNLTKRTDRGINTKVEAVDDLIKFYRSTKSPLVVEDIFQLYERILNAKEASEHITRPD